MKRKRYKLVNFIALLSVLFSVFHFAGAPETAKAAAGTAPSLLITEIMAAPKTSEYYEYVELYNTTSQPIDLTNYKIHYYTDPALPQKWTDPNAKKWDIVAKDDITGGPTKMTIEPHGTKIVWIVKPYTGSNPYTLNLFNTAHGSSATGDQMVYVQVKSGEGLDNAVQRYVAIVAPGGDASTDRISMAGYNLRALTCTYANDPKCDFNKNNNQSVNYFLPSTGLDPVARTMERKDPESLNQTPTPGVLTAGQQQQMTALPAEVVQVQAVRNGGTAAISWTEPTDLGGKADYTHVNIYDRSTRLPVAGPIAKGTTTATVSGLTDGVDYTFTLATVSAAGVESEGVSKLAEEPAPPVSPKPASLLITEIMAASVASGDPYEFVELYNTTSQPIDLTGYQIHYYQISNTQQPLLDSTAKKWDIVAKNAIDPADTTTVTNMKIPPHGTKVVWLLKPQHGTYKTKDTFIANYNAQMTGFALTEDQIVYAKLGTGDNLDNATQKYVAIVGPGKDPTADRISIAAYNVNAGTGSCAYRAAPYCDFNKTSTAEETVIYFLPGGGLDPATKQMERRTGTSGLNSPNQKPTPGKLITGQEPPLPAEVLNPAVVRNGDKATVSWMEPTDLGGKADYAHVNIYNQFGVKAAGPVAKGTTTATVSGLTDGVDYTFTVVTVSGAGVESVGVKPGGSGITQEELGLRSAKIKVATVGDSITRNTGISPTYPQSLGKWLGPDYEVRNYGVSGTTMLKQGDSPFWSKPEFQQSKDWNPDIVVIMFGSNDSKPGNWNQYKDQFAGDYADMINQYKSLPSQPKVFVNLPPKVQGANTFNISDTVLQDEIIPKINQVAVAQSVPVIDMYSATTGKPEWFYDKVHPNEEGTKAIAKTVYEKLSGYFTIYGDFNTISQQGAVIPGLKQGIVPQAAAYVPGQYWMLVSYYRDGGKASGITVTNLTTGKLVKAVEFYENANTPYTGHAGGLAVSGNHVWLSSNSNVYPIPLQDVVAAKDGDRLMLPGPVKIETNGSFLTYADGILWAGEFARSDYPTDPSHHMANREQAQHTAWVTGYKLSASDAIDGPVLGATGAAVPNYILSIPQEIQGMAITDDKIVLSRSYGRNNDSTLLAYKLSLNEPAHTQTSKFGGTPVPVWFLDGKNLLNTLTMPPMSEGLFELSGQLHVLFESGAQIYLDGKYPLDKMQLVDAGTFLAEKPESGYTPALTVSEIMAAPKAAGEPFEYVELYNTTDQPIDLTGYQIQYYTNPALAQPWTDPNAKKWPIVKKSALTGNASDQTNMTIAPHGTKVIWLIKPSGTTSINDFNNEYYPGRLGLKEEQIAFAKLGTGEGLDNAVQRFVAIVGPGGNPDADRISMAAYNVNAGTGSCKYASSPFCDFNKTASSQQSVIYYLPAEGLNPTTKSMERKTSGSLNQTPTPGKLSSGQVPGYVEDPNHPNNPDKPADAPQPGTLIITEVMAAPKATNEPFEYVELYNTTDQPIDLTGYQIQYYTNPSLAQPWTDGSAKKWPIVKKSAITGNAADNTNMTIAPRGTKVVWLIKPGGTSSSIDFNNEFYPNRAGLKEDQFVYVTPGASEGLDNAVQRFVAIVGPGGNPDADRISMAAYNANAGTGSCKYASAPYCDFNKTTSSQQSVIYFLPAGGLDAASRLMERRTPDSLNQTPTPGRLTTGQIPGYVEDPNDPNNPDRPGDNTGNPGVPEPVALAITEIMAAPKGNGELYEYVELYNATGNPINLTGYQLHYYTNAELLKPWTGDSKKWSIVAMDDIAGGETDMTVQPYGTKVVWLVKPLTAGGGPYKVEDFIAEYDPSLPKENIVYARLGPGEGLENAVKRHVAIVGPGGSPTADRISMAAYNVNSDKNGCKYAGAPYCDFAKTTTTQQSVNYFLPAAGLDSIGKLMERREPESLNQAPTPGKLLAGQVQVGFRAIPGDQAVTLQWEPMNRSLLGYRLYQNGKPLTSSAATVTSGTYSYTVGGLTNGTSYQFEVAGVLQSVYGQPGGEIAAFYPVLAVPYSYSGLFIEGLPSRIILGDSVDVKVKMKYSGKPDNDVTGLSVFGSSDPSVVSINAAGKAMAVGTGVSVITAVYGSESAAFTVLVDKSNTPKPEPPQRYVPPAAAPASPANLDAAAFTVKTETAVSGQSVARIQVDGAQLRAAFQSLKDNEPFVTLSYNGVESAMEVILPASVLEDGKQAKLDSRLVVYKNGVSFDIPLSALHLQTGAQQHGASMDNMNVRVVISALPGTEQDQIRSEAAANGAVLLSDVYGFQVMLEAGGKTIEIEDFGRQPVTRTLVVNGAVNAKEVTGVYVSPEGTFHFVPSVLREEADGNTYVSMRNTHNSAYAVVRSNKTYDDIQEHWSKSDVELLASKQMLNGLAKERFLPDQTITRAEFAALMVNAAGLSGQPLNADAAGTFKDVSDGAWYAKSVYIAAMKGLVVGYDGSLFRPDALVTREEMAVMMVRALRLADPSAELPAAPLSFSDKEAIGEWARTSVAALVQAGIVEGMTPETFVPADHATRAQAAAMAKRMLEHIRYLMD